MDAPVAEEVEPGQCSSSLQEEIRRLEERHTKLEREMKKILEERERVVKALRLQQEEASAGHVRRSMSMSPPPKNSSGPRRTSSEKLSDKDLRAALDLKSLSMAEDRYNDILQSMGQAVYMFTTSSEVTYWNRMAERLYGWSAAEAIGRDLIELLIDKSAVESATKILSRLYVGESWVGQFSLKKKSGEIFPAMMTNTPFYDNDGKLVGVICVSSDARPFMKSRDFAQADSWQIPFAATFSSLATKILTHLRGNAMEVNPAAAGGSSSGEDLTQASRVFAGLRSRSGSWTGRLWPWSNTEAELASAAAVLRKDEHEHPEAPASNQPIVSMDVNSSMSSTGTASSSSSRHVWDDLESPEYEITWESLSLHDQIGQGSCATVHRGTWCGLDVAVKVFHELQYNESGMEDFRKEVSIMKKLRHPNIVLFLGAASTQDRLYIVTELMPRGSLFKLLHRRPTGLDWKRKLSMALDVARGMTYLHNCTPPIVHRDLKSTNLLVDKNLKVKVGDFSLSRLKHSNFLTGNARMGTSQWMPPEVLRSEASSEKSDVYSFGVILWELATEEVPWKDLDPLQVIAVVGFKDKRMPLPESLDPKYAATIQDCWKSAWEERPSFEELTVRLKEMLIAATRDS
ncbi:probable serine/threonine-protein kinase SIS8 isoform X1 [Selaginella moellendorffii]|uniref:probable serine/threonine-protein kinase SIS8 isoform X1 n=2 Tax=Selaginella moellendorffii TaxID=88036 RepID=UPI000D1CC49A|nr:probable serine/threonine-protein kinase SIS8 isoform X1 [Selaginella moellendorffii]|eukprot:XP_024519968.1 probable serine/threonine-protein kinase SIS8 isoform X1 [Selaginella moellendorffii]